jgi:hypothetical protein
MIIVLLYELKQKNGFSYKLKQRKVFIIMIINNEYHNIVNLTNSAPVCNYGNK